MKYCFHCGTQLKPARPTSAHTERFTCGKCGKGYLLAGRQRRCLFIGDKIPEDMDALYGTLYGVRAVTIGGQGPGSQSMPKPKPDDFDFGFGAEEHDFGL